MLDGKDIYARDADPVVIRRRIGMVFQKPRHSRQCRSSITCRRPETDTVLEQRWELEEVVERSLRQAALWMR